MTLCGAGCGGEVLELGFEVTGGDSCAPFCKVNRVDAYLLRQLDQERWCLLDKKSFAPAGAQSMQGFDLPPHSTFRIKLLGFCGKQCYCGHDDIYPVDPKAGALIELKRVSSLVCTPPAHEGGCP